MNGVNHGLCVCVCAGQFYLRYNVRSHVTKAWRLQHFLPQGGVSVTSTPLLILPPPSPTEVKVTTAAELRGLSKVKRIYHLQSTLSVTVYKYI